MKHILKSASTFLLVGTALALSGCVSDNYMTGSISEAPGHGLERYPIVVEKTPQVLQIDAYQGHLTTEQANAVRAFVYKGANARQAQLTVSYPAKKGPAFNVTGEIAELMVAQGVSKSQVKFVSYPGAATDPVRISFIDTYAHTKPCGTWTRDLTDTNDNADYDNLGCALQTNIAAEVYNPDTFIAPNLPSQRLAGRDATAVKSLDASASSTSSSSSSGSSSASVAPATTP